MSYDIRIEKNGTVAAATIDPKDMPLGGTFCPEENDELTFNITYNYSKYFCDYIDKDEGIRWLYGQKVEDTIPVLKYALSELEALAVKEDRDPTLVDGPYNPEDYWCPCAVNAAEAIRGLLTLANQCLDGTWYGD